MSSLGRVYAEFLAGWNSFIRRRSAVFFTFFFPVILIVIFGALIQVNPGGGGGLFSQPAGYYVPGYLAVVVLFTPISRLGGSVARHREGNRFEKLSTTPLTRAEWLAAHTLVNVVLVGIASVILLVVLMLITPATFHLSWLLVPFVVFGVVVFAGIGAMLGRITGSQDGVVAASNTVALPMLFLADTFVTPDMLPKTANLFIDLLPLTYFSRGVRAVTYGGTSATTDLVILVAVAVVAFVIGSWAIPRTD